MGDNTIPIQDHTVSQHSLGVEVDELTTPLRPSPGGIQRNTKDEQTTTALMGLTRLLPVYLTTLLLQSVQV